MIYIGTWNIMTMLKTGKMNEIDDDILKTQLPITNNCIARAKMERIWANQ